MVNDIKEKLVGQKQEHEVLVLRFNDLKGKILNQEPDQVKSLAKPNAAWINGLVASQEMVGWLQSNLQNHLKSSQWRTETKNLVRTMQEKYEVSVTNISAATRKTIAKWGRDLVDEDIDDLVRTNADVIAAALAPELNRVQDQVTEEPTVVSKTSKVAQKVLPLMQTQINELNDKFEELNGAEWEAKVVDTLLEVSLMKAIFGDSTKAVSLVLNLVKTWGFFRPDRKEEMESVVATLLDFQSGKGHLTLMDFQNSIIPLLGESGVGAFRGLTADLTGRVNKASQEMKYAPAM